MYDTKEEAHQKLTSCLCLFKEEPAYIENVHQNGKHVSLEFFNTRQRITDIQSITHEGWEFRNLGPRVGYININEREHKEASYAVRSAVRLAHNTQGLSHKNMRLSSLRGLPKMKIPPKEMDWLYVAKGIDAANMIEGKYPTLKDIQEQFEKEPLQVSMAFHREFSVYRHDIGPFYLEYKGKQIGYSEDLDLWRVNKKYLYLYESLEHNNLKVS